jgi:hypothetical protein
VKSQEAVERAIRLITPAPGEEDLLRWRTTLNTLVEPARFEMAEQIASSGDRELRELTRKEFDGIGAVDGIAALGPLVDDPEPLLLKHLNCAEIYIEAVTRKLTLLPDETAVRRDRMAGFPYGTLIGTDLLIYHGGEPFTGNVKIRGPIVPALANFKTQLEDRYVMVLHSMGKQQIPSTARTQARELKAVASEGK